MDYFFDDLNFFYEDEDFSSFENILNIDDFLADDMEAFYFSKEKDEYISKEKYYAENNDDIYESFSLSEIYTDEPRLPSENYHGINDFSKGAYIKEIGIDMERGVFNSISEVSSQENIQNLDNNTVINIDARSYNSISQEVDLDSISNYIADRLYEAISSSSEVIHSV